MTEPLKTFRPAIGSAGNAARRSRGSRAWMAAAAIVLVAGATPVPAQPAPADDNPVTTEDTAVDMGWLGLLGLLGLAGALPRRRNRDERRGPDTRL